MPSYLQLFFFCSCQNQCGFFYLPVCFYMHFCCHGSSQCCLSLHLMRLEEFTGALFFPLASITAALAAFRLLSCSSSFRCLLLWVPKWRAEGQVISLDLILAPPPSLILTICGVSEHINLYHNHLRNSVLPG